jgi:hypothetical protein
MNIFQNIAYNNPNGAKEIINGYGQLAKRNPDMLARQLASVMSQNQGEDVEIKLAEVHPDYALIEKAVLLKQPKVEQKDCDCKKNDLFSSADGQEIKKAVEDIKENSKKSETKEAKSEKTELLIIGAISLIGLALVLKK